MLGQNILRSIYLINHIPPCPILIYFLILKLLNYVQPGHSFLHVLHTKCIYMIQDNYSNMFINMRILCANIPISTKWTINFILFNSENTDMKTTPRSLMTK